VKGGCSILSESSSPFLYRKIEVMLDAGKPVADISRDFRLTKKEVKIVKNEFLRGISVKPLQLRKLDIKTLKQ
jgi:hypothetical protein